MNDHIPDVTKMINDTPRTDAEEFYPHDSKYKVCDADFARTLERELNAANVEIDEKRKDVVWLATEKAKLEERIKRLEGHIEYLESVGDSLFDGVTRIEADQRWRRAKEAKP